MRLLNVGEIKVGDWVEWCDGAKWYRSETAVCAVKPFHTSEGVEIAVWWGGGAYAWPIDKCRKVKGPDETT